MKILKIMLLTLTALMLASGVALAAYSYYANIQVQETDGNDYDYLPIIVDVDNEYLVDNGYINSTGIDTRVLSGSTELKHMVADNKTLFVAPLIGAHSTGNYKYTLGNDNLESMPVITGYDGYVTVADNSSLELGDNFTIEVNGYLDMTSENGTLFYKPESFRAYISADGNLTASSLGKMGWQIATSFNDPDADWVNDSQSSDNNTTTYAAETIAASSWGKFLEFYLDDIYIDKVRVYFTRWGGLGNVDSVDIDLYIDEAWVNLSTADLSEDGYAEVSVSPSRIVSGARIRFHNVDGADSVSLYLKEFQFEGILADMPPTVTATGIDSGNNIKVTSQPVLSFNGTGDFVGMGNQDELKITGSITCIAWVYFNEVSTGTEQQIMGRWNNGATTNNMYGLWLTGMDVGGYDRIDFDIVDGTTWKGSSSDFVVAANTTYFVAGGWNATTGGVFVRINDEDYTYTMAPGNINGGDRNFYLGCADGAGGREKWFNGYMWGVKVYNRYLSQDELDTIQNGGVITDGLVADWPCNEGTGNTLYDHTTVKSNGTLYYPDWVDGALSISVDSTYGDTIFGDTDVTDNDNSWIFLQNNIMPYADNISITVNGTQVLWFQPDTIIIGDTLPDRATTDGAQDGIITWGENPEGLGVTMASLVPSSQPAASPAGEVEGIDVIPEGNVPSGGTVDTTALHDNPLYPIVSFVSEHTDLTEEQIWFGGATLIIFIGMGLAIGKVPNHLLLAGVIGLVLSGFFTAMRIYQWWMLLVFGFIFLASILFERKPVL